MSHLTNQERHNIFNGAGVPPLTVADCHESVAHRPAGSGFWAGHWQCASLRLRLAARVTMPVTVTQPGSPSLRPAGGLEADTQKKDGRTLETRPASAVATVASTFRFRLPAQTPNLELGTWSLELGLYVHHIDRKDEKKGSGCAACWQRLALALESVRITSALMAATACARYCHSTEGC